jgi:hypothetical protein
LIAFSKQSERLKAFGDRDKTQRIIRYFIVIIFNHYEIRVTISKN